MKVRMGKIEAYQIHFFSRDDKRRTWSRPFLPLAWHTLVLSQVYHYIVTKMEVMRALTICLVIFVVDTSSMARYLLYVSSEHAIIIHSSIIYLKHNVVSVLLQK